VPRADTAGRLTGWLTAPAPRGRGEVFARLCYAFVPLDLLVLTPWVRTHGRMGGLYRPLAVARLLHLPTPTPHLVGTLFVVLLGASLVALTGRLRRSMGWTVAVAYFAWMLVAMSYGKVDHDRFAFVLALFLLPTIRRARLDDSTPDEAVGWALRVVQLAVVATYVLAAVAKFRFGGLAWLDSATLLRAVVRRGTFLSHPLANHPWTLHTFQYVLVGAELCSPLLLVRGRIAKVAVGVAYAFHAMTYAMLTIGFFAHLVALAAFLPLERVARWRHRSPGPALAQARVL